MQTNEKIIALGVGRKGSQVVGEMLGKVEIVEFADVRFQASFEIMMLGKTPLAFNVLNVDECKEIIDENFLNSDLIFVIGGSPLTPYMAKAAKEAGKLTIVIALTNNEELKATLKEVSDALISFDENISWDEQIKLSQNVVEAIANLITKSGFVNLDFEDIKAILQDTGTAFLGTGYAEGDNRAKIAALQAINMCIELKNAKRILLNITTGSEVSLSEMSDAAEIIKLAVAPYAQVIWGHVIDDDMGKDLQVTFIAGMGNKRSVPIQDI